MLNMENIPSNQPNVTNTKAHELLPKLQQQHLEHPALIRMRSKMTQSTGVQAIVLNGGF
jgi:hypothetical protein